MEKPMKKTLLGMTFLSCAVAAWAADTPAPADLKAIHGGMSRPVDVGNIKVAKATGPDARTVAEVNSQSAALKGKTVAVRGMVVKFNPEILGKNWVHLRDGSGSDADGSNDVLVTTKDQTKIGDVVLAKGIVATNRDLGSGYSYKVLIEEATLSK
jgi:hypothetical protein